ncbi:MAG: glycosyltransferase family 4 protein [Nitrospiria bacterium]
MRILFLTENFPPERNAAATRVYERAVYWAKWGHEISVITCAPNFPEGRIYDGYQNRWYQTEVMDGIRVVRVKTFISRNEGIVLRTLDFVSYMIMAFSAGLFEKRPDVVAATSPQFFAAVGGWVLASVRHVPFIFELGDLWPESIKAVGVMRDNVLLRWLEKFELFLYRKSAVVVALTQSFKDNLMRRGIPEDKIVVVINGVDLPRYRPCPRDEELDLQWGVKGDFVIGYIGTLGMAHALENVLDAAERLSGEPDVRFLFVGPGAARDGLMAEARRRGLQNIVFVPPQPKEKMPAFWSLCDVALIHLKDNQVFESVIPSKIFEAMGMGLPLLLSAPKGEASQIIEREGAGICVSAEDPKALANAVISLKRDKKLYQGLSQRSLAAAPHYSREHQARNMIEVFESVIKRKVAQ